MPASPDYKTVVPDRADSLRNFQNLLPFIELLSILSSNKIGSQVVPFQKFSKFCESQLSFLFGRFGFKKLVLFCHSMSYLAMFHQN